MNIQVVCNDSGHFLDVEVKWPGSVLDTSELSDTSRVFYKELSAIL